MQSVKLPGTDITTSRFIFGTADLFNAGTRRQRLGLLEAAIENGFTHFDTAPYYGFGWAERDLGSVLRHHPIVSVTTKVGLYSAGGETQPQLSVLFRKLAGRVFKSVSRPAVNFSVNMARQSLAGSLKRLCAERVAIYMLHEPEFKLVDTDEWQRWLQDEVAIGRVGTFGLALTAEKLAPFLDHSPGLAEVVQVFDSLEGKEADVLLTHGKPMQITYGYISAARSRGSLTAVPELLKYALARNAHGAIIVSTKRLARLAQFQCLLADKE